ncbi:MAG TPA: haloacid dehalogenase [Richelia sp.]|nr:haloacid dehalogenase [Richelia sp.]
MVKKFLALDFDGVICDGLIEYFAVAWQTYCQVWQSGNQNLTNPPAGILEKFYNLRVVIETGWEMPILIKALVEKIKDDDIYQNWKDIVIYLIEKDSLSPHEIGIKLDIARDERIKKNLESWLDLHRFYPGVVETIQSAITNKIQVYIITTKESRFVQTLLHKAGININNNRIFGKEVKRPKHETMRQLIIKNQIEPEALWFVEDRLETLLMVEKQPDLNLVHLYLADWGYNTPEEQEEAYKHSRIQLISLSKFSQYFSS